MATIPASENEFPEVLLAEGAAPAAPGTGLVKMYAKSDGLPYSKDDAGAESPMTPNAHIADTTDAHDASAVSFDPTGATNITATEVQGALDELDAAIAGGGIPATIIDAAGDLIVGTAADTAARLAVGATAGMVLRSNGSAASWGHTSGIVQVKTAVWSSDVTTTAATMQDSGLQLAFTPLYDNSVLHISVDGECSFQRVAGTIDGRYGWVEIYNSTDAVAVATEIRGQILVAASAVASNQVPAIALKGLYTVNSTAARTFKLRYMAGVVTNIQAQITGSRTGGVIMTIMEVRP